MPELPEVESARAVIARAALDRRIVDVDDSDTFVCRPHAPGEIRAALVGRTLTTVHRRGKSMWCDTSDDGPVLGIHLGMSGKIVIAGADGTELDGGDYWERGRAPGDHRYTRVHRVNGLRVPKYVWGKVWGLTQGHQRKLEQN